MSRALRSATLSASHATSAPPSASLPAPFEAPPCRAQPASPSAAAPSPRGPAAAGGRRATQRPRNWACEWRSIVSVIPTITGMRPPAPSPGPLPPCAAERSMAAAKAATSMWAPSTTRARPSHTPRRISSPMADSTACDSAAYSSSTSSSARSRAEGGAGRGLGAAAARGQSPAAERGVRRGGGVRPYPTAACARCGQRRAGCPPPGPSG